MTGPAALVLAAGVAVTLVFGGYVAAGGAATLGYRTRRAGAPAEDVAFVVVSVASRRVRSALTGTLDHTVERFPGHDVYCVVDEGADLEDAVRRRDDVRAVVVPDGYECEARAKGRAIQYFVERGVADDRWYAFLDDDNRVLDDAFLYEIPHYERRGYDAANPVLVPRPGRSMVTYMADHVRLLDDLTAFRLFTGVLGRPYLGLHGELLLVRGAALAEIGFDRATLVEDFAFAMELCARGRRTWQSATRVSILSPHTVGGFFRQRRRWFLGIVGYLPRSPAPAALVVGARSVLWSLGIAGNWVLFPLWVAGAGLALPAPVHGATLAAGAVYALVCLYGAARHRGAAGVALAPLVPLCSLVEHLSPLYALATRDTGFAVIEK